MSPLVQMIFLQYIDANWLQHSLQLWVEKCQNAVSADSVELLKEVTSCLKRITLYTIVCIQL